MTIDACSIDRVRALLVVGRDSLDPAVGTLLRCDRAAFHMTRTALCACVRQLVPLGSHPVSPRPYPEVRTIPDLLRLLDDAYSRLRVLVIAGGTKPDDRVRLVGALTHVNTATTDLLRVVGGAATHAAGERSMATAA